MSESLQKITTLLAGSAPAKWIFAGDSITHGALHTFGQRHYPEHFAERVRWERVRTRDAVIITGVSGWRIEHIANDLEWTVLQYDPQVVSINVGMNDAAAGAEGLTAFVEFYRDVLTRLRERGNPAVVLHTPNAILPDGQRDPAVLLRYAQEIRKLATEFGAVLVDHEADWLAAQERGVMAYWLSDPIHPNEYGHRAMAHTLFRALDLFDPKSLTCRLLVP